MAELEGRLQREFRTMERMVAIHCADHHRGHDTCGACREFLDYARKRLEKCPYGTAKPVCAQCPVHCYKKAQREQARVVMRYAGPRMVLRHPWLSLAHLLDKRRKVEHPMTLRGSKRTFSNAPRR